MDSTDRIKQQTQKMVVKSVYLIQALILIPRFVINSSQNLFVYQEIINTRCVSFVVASESWWAGFGKIYLRRVFISSQYKLITSGINTEIKGNGQKLETVKSVNYLGSVITDEASKPEILSRIAQTSATLTRLKPVWNDRSISLSSKICLMHSLVTSIFLSACESWTLTAELQRRI